MIPAVLFRPSPERSDPSRMCSLRTCFLRCSHASLILIAFIRPDLPRGFLACPEFVQILVFPISVHGEEKAIMAVGHELTFSCQTFQRLALENALGTGEVVEYAPVEHEKTGADQSIRSWFFDEALDLALPIGFQHAKTRDRRDRCDGRGFAMALVEFDQITNVDVAKAVAVGEQKRVIVCQVAGHTLQAAARHGFKAGVR